MLPGPLPTSVGSPLVTPLYLSQILIFFLLSPMIVILLNFARSPVFVPAIAFPGTVAVTLEITMLHLYGFCSYRTTGKARRSPPPVNC